ncbi:MAG: hypothetical protein WA071_00455, partial [Undibacterium umbellatum]|uniref:hypothetical protein n=1 Tax=Undibacterium umbellatum TaxID=2762300 RepID=UPI003BB6BD77
PHNARWTALDSLSIGKAIDCLVRLASPRYEANASHPIYEMSSKCFAIMRQLELADVVAPLRLNRSNNAQAVRVGQRRQHC